MSRDPFEYLDDEQRRALRCSREEQEQADVLKELAEFAREDRLAWFSQEDWEEAY